MTNGIFTLLLMAIFVGIVVWAWSSGRKADFEEAARLPLDEERGATTGESRER